MSTRKERKAEIVKEVEACRQEEKQKKEAMADLPKERKQAERKKLREERKEAKAQRRKEIRQMPKDEKKAAKKHDKMFRKIKNRPVRAGIWAAVLCVLMIAVVNLAPIISNVAGLFQISLESNTPEGIQARENAAVVAKQVSDEGIVLLENVEDLLPLQDEALNVFGTSSFNIKYGGSGSGASNSEATVDLYTAFDEAGISYNKELYDFYIDQGADSGKGASTGLMQIVSMLVGKSQDEPEIDYLTDEVIGEAREYSSNALVVLSSAASEAADLAAAELKPTENSMDLLAKVCENFDHVVVVINAGNAMQLGFLEEYDSIGAVLWMGTPGPYGCQSLAEILTGTVNPSGRLVDTYAYDVTSAPASVTLGDYAYDNVKGMHFLNYNEGIYVGYRFYESYYLKDEAGYRQAVQYPFGYGLSYTEFDWEAGDLREDGETIRLEVKVTNEGEQAGKEVVQAYYSAPYTEGGIEKSAIELAAYSKTGILQPGESETVAMEFAVRSMASYDMDGEQAYVLEAGTYEIQVGRNVHEPAESWAYEVETPLVYETDEVTGTELVNRFDYAEGDLTYLSRSDWDGTYPDAADISRTASADAAAGFAASPEKAEGELPVMGADNGIMLADLKGLDYDDPAWEQFLDQFTLEEMRELFLDGAYATTEIERLGVPQTVLLDGPAGINSFFSEVTAAAYPTEVVIASTWNDDLAYLIGNAVGMEANAYGVQGWYAPGMNIHRTSMGGRNFEYYSEDPLLSGKMAAAMVRGAQEHDILVFIKHFVLNDQEINARSGVAVWLNEQAMREIYLRPFEIAVKESEPTGAMSSFILIGTKWSGGNPELLQEVLREEWGFSGLVSTDAVLGSFMDVNLAVRYGNELMLDPFLGGNRKYFNKLYREDPVGIAEGLRDRVHTICYVFVNDTDMFD